MLCWISSILAQYALLLNVGDLAGDMFLNFGFTMLMEIPAFVFIYTMADRLGRVQLITYSKNTRVGEDTFECIINKTQILEIAASLSIGGTCGTYFHEVQP